MLGLGLLVAQFARAQGGPDPSNDPNYNPNSNPGYQNPGYQNPGYQNPASGPASRAPTTRIKARSTRNQPMWGHLRPAPMVTTPTIPMPVSPMATMDPAGSPEESSLASGRGATVGAVDIAALAAGVALVDVDTTEAAHAASVEAMDAASAAAHGASAAAMAAALVVAHAASAAAWAAASAAAHGASAAAMDAALVVADVAIMEEAMLRAVGDAATVEADVALGEAVAEAAPMGAVPTVVVQISSIHNSKSSRPTATAVGRLGFDDTHGRTRSSCHREKCQACRSKGRRGKKRQ